MKERPILFSGEMINAIRENRKNQTRRIIQPQFGSKWGEGVRFGSDTYSVHTDIHNPDGTWKWINCPYGKPGDRLWVKETHKKDYNPPFVYYRADYNGREHRDGQTLMPLRLVDTPWKPSIFMPRQLSRITLEITAVRVERLQDITDRDAWNEGSPHLSPESNLKQNVSWFKFTWDTINAKRGYAWELNPWLWVIDFKVIEFKDWL